MKQELRRRLLTQRNAITPGQKQTWDKAINQALINHDWFKHADKILAHYPIGSEPDIRPALEEALRQGKQVYLPKCEPATGEMRFFRVQSLESLQPGAHGIPEPEGNNYELRITDYALCLVPGIAFDAEGYRLGYGGGYYDRFLAQHAQLTTLGVCYEMMMQARLPREARDIPVTRVLAEGERYEHRRQE